MQSYSTKIFVYTLTLNSTVDYPQYRLQTTYDIALYPSNFSSLSALKGAITERTGAGFLRSQFFRVQFKPDFDEKQQFLATSADLKKHFEGYAKEIYLDVVVVRYTRIQADQLTRSISGEEQQNLTQILNKKRVYTKRDTETQGFEEIKTDIAADERVLRAFEVQHMTRQDMRELISQGKQSQYLSAEQVAGWCDRVFAGQWNNVLIPPNDYPIVAQEYGGYVRVIVRNRLAGVLNYVAGVLNSSTE